ncbi:hypothetical protein FRB94_004017 [Tulasnella sp. JGI-2019a]|nr:hypothetical protein FRB93_003350 [Tulasnella sp. JGI-2019a]KAG9002275.1 hypothetical protein FRB94_004017 [Tulasnella sp. JGI-2019a]
MLFGIKSIVLAFSAVSTVFADHQVTIYNYCELPKYRHIESPAFNDVSGLIGVNGGFYNVSIPSLVSSVIIFGESGECPGIDGPGCTRLECDFSNPSYQHCNLSRADGFSIPLAWTWTDGSCTGGHWYEMKPLLHALPTHHLTAKVAAPALLIAGSPTRTTVHPSGNAILRTLVYYFTCVALRR